MEKEKTIEQLEKELAEENEALKNDALYQEKINLIGNLTDNTNNINQKISDREEELYGRFTTDGERPEYRADYAFSGKFLNNIKPEVLAKMKEKINFKVLTNGQIEWIAIKLYHQAQYEDEKIKLLKEEKEELYRKRNALDLEIRKREDKARSLSVQISKLRYKEIEMKNKAKETKKRVTITEREKENNRVLANLQELLKYIEGK